MERKLAEFRAKKAKEKQNMKESTNVPEQISTEKVKEGNEQFETETECGFVTRIFKKLYSVEFLLKFALWLSLLMFFISIEFGSVYFIVSMTFIMFYSMKNRMRKPNELSAYSVFNKNFERLDGTFTAEQFEQQMIYGGAKR